MDLKLQGKPVYLNLERHIHLESQRSELLTWSKSYWRKQLRGTLKWYCGWIRSGCIWTSMRTEEEEKGTTEDEMAGWHHWLNGCESEWTPGVGDGQGGLACCDSWGRKESDTAEQLNWTDIYHCLSSLSPLPPIPPSIRVFPMNQLFARGGQSTGVSALASFLPKKSQGWSPSEWTGWISMQSKGLWRGFSNTTV